MELVGYQRHVGDVQPIYRFTSNELSAAHGHPFSPRNTRLLFSWDKDAVEILVSRLRSWAERTEDPKKRQEGKASCIKKGDFWWIPAPEEESFTWAEFTRIVKRIAAGGLTQAEWVGHYLPVDCIEFIRLAWCPHGHFGFQSSVAAIVLPKIWDTHPRMARRIYWGLGSYRARMRYYGEEWTPSWTHLDAAGDFADDPTPEEWLAQQQTASTPAPAEASPLEYIDGKISLAAFARFLAETGAEIRFQAVGSSESEQAVAVLPGAERLALEISEQALKALAGRADAAHLRLYVSLRGGLLSIFVTAEEDPTEEHSWELSAALSPALTLSLRLGTQSWSVPVGAA